MTARQFLELGEDPPGVRLELVDGEIEVAASPNLNHSYLDRMLTVILGNHILEHDLGQLFGDVDTIFGEHDVRRPDLLFYAKDRIHLLGVKAMEIPPDLAVEIVSPTSGRTDREIKFEQYAKGGVAHYWIVDPQQRTIEGYRLEAGKYVATAAGRVDQAVQLPPFENCPIPLSKLWRP